MTSLHAICGLGPPQSKILATPMSARTDWLRKWNMQAVANAKISAFLLRSV